MMGYIYYPDHQKAIDLYDVLGEGLTCHYKSEEITSLKNALDYWKANGQRTHSKIEDISDINF